MIFGIVRVYSRAILLGGRFLVLPVLLMELIAFAVMDMESDGIVEPGEVSLPHAGRAELTQSILSGPQLRPFDALDVPAIPPASCHAVRPVLYSTLPVHDVFPGLRVFGCTLSRPLVK